MSGKIKQTLVKTLIYLFENFLDHYDLLTYLIPIICLKKYCTMHIKWDFSSISTEVIVQLMAVTDMSWCHLNVLRVFVTRAEFPNSVPITVNRPSNTKLRLQVKQARLPTKMAVALGLHVYYNAFSVTRMNLRS